MHGDGDGGSIMAVRGGCVYRSSFLRKEELNKINWFFLNLVKSTYEDPIFTICVYKINIFKFKIELCSWTIIYTFEDSLQQQMKTNTCLRVLLLASEIPIEVFFFLSSVFFNDFYFILVLYLYTEESHVPVDFWITL